MCCLHVPGLSIPEQDVVFVINNEIMNIAYKSGFRCATKLHLMIGLKKSFGLLGSLTDEKDFEELSIFCKNGFFFLLFTFS